MPALSVTVAGQPFDIVPFLVAKSEYGLVFKSAYDAFYFYNNTVTKITDADYPGFSSVTPTSIVRSGTIVTVTLPAPTNWQSGSNVTISGAAQTDYNGVWPIAVTSSTTFTFQITTTPATPATGTIAVKGGRVTVPGIVFLDGYFFVMDQNNIIYNCALGDPLTWNALDFITANIEPGNGVAIAKSQNYVIALKTWSTEFFYDAGNAVGSPLSPVMSAFTKVGCAHAGSVADLDGTVLWMSKTKEKGRSVHKMNGLGQEKVSTPDVERILNSDNLSGVYSYGLKISGHMFYILGLKNSNITLAYDSVTGFWSQWTSLTAVAGKATTIVQAGGIATATCTAHGLLDGDAVTISGATQSEYNGLFQISYVDANTYTFPVAIGAVTPATGTILTVGYTETYFKYTKYVYCAGRDLVIHEDTGSLCEITESVYMDESSPINFKVRTGKFDGDTVDRKTLSQLRVIGNKVGGMAAVRWSDDDYVTNSKYRPVNLSSDQARLTRCGSFRRRSFDIRHIANAPVQVAAFELELQKEK